MSKFKVGDFVSVNVPASEHLSLSEDYLFPKNPVAFYGRIVEEVVNSVFPYIVEDEEKNRCPCFEDELTLVVLN